MITMMDMFLFYGNLQKYDADIFPSVILKKVLRFKYSSTKK